MKHKGLTCLAWAFLAVSSQGQFQFTSLSVTGATRFTNTYAEGVVTIEQSDDASGPFIPVQNLFTTGLTATATVSMEGARGFFRAYTTDLTPGTPNGRPGFTNLTRVYGRLTTLAGTGLQSAGGLNSWQPQFEGAPAIAVELSRPHIAMADLAGNIYIADKEAHAIRMIRPDGILVTVAGINTGGNGADTPTPALEVALFDPNGLYVQPDGTVYILDLGNSKIRRLDPDGLLTTVLTDINLIYAGRGLWVSPLGDEIYYSSESVVKKWTPLGGLSTFATGFVELGNLHRNPITGDIVATDRLGHRVWRIESDGGKEIIAGDGTAGVGFDGGVARDTPLNEVRAVWFLPSGGYFLGTHRGSQIWYVDTEGFIQLFLNGLTSDTHAGDGDWFYNPFDYRVSEIRAVTVDFEGNLLITEHDAGYVRKVEFLPVQSD